MSAPDLVADIKEDFGICGESKHDAWFERNVRNIWSRMEKYTSRSLCAPPQLFVDDWSRIVLGGMNQPIPVPYHPPRASAFLRYFPVVEVTAIEVGGQAMDPSGVRFEPKTGKLFSLTGQGAEDLACQLYQSATRITYRAGWPELPGDLYDVVRGALAPLWATRSSGLAGLPGTISSIQVIDVGQVDMSAGNAFVQASSKLGLADPMLGPYQAILDTYVDWRAKLGSALDQVTEQLGQTALSGIGEAPMDGRPYVRQDGQWVPLPMDPQALEYRYSTNVGPPPSPGQVRISLANDFLYVAKVTDGNFDTAAVFLPLFTPGRQIMVQDRDDATRWRRFSILGAVTDAGTYWTVPVTSIALGSPINNNQPIGVMVFG